MDIFHIYLMWNCNFLFEKMKISEKDAEDGWVETFNLEEKDKNGNNTALDLDSDDNKET